MLKIFGSRSDDDKQKPNGALIRKQFIVFPVEAPLSPDLTMRYLLEYLVGSGVKQLGTIAQISFGAWPNLSPDPIGSRDKVKRLVGSGVKRLRGFIN